MPYKAKTFGAEKRAAQRIAERKRYDLRRGPDRQWYGNKRWRKLREWFLSQADNTLCVDCLAQGIVEPATDVDHIQGRREYPELAYDTDNLRGLCHSHHSRRTAREAWHGSKAKVNRCTLVCGPPGSGKTRYVGEHKKWGDLVLDLDTLTTALSGEAMYDKPAGLLSYAIAARDAVIEQLASDHDRPRAWVIGSLPKRAEREHLAKLLGADVVMLDVDPQECIKRIRQDPRRNDRWQAWEPIVRKWWDSYER